MQLFERLQGEKAVWQKPCDLLNVEFVWGVRKYVIFGVVVYSNVRELRTNERPIRSTLPASSSPPLLFSIHILTTEHDLPPATSGHASTTRETFDFRVYTTFTQRGSFAELSMLSGWIWLFLAIVSRYSWSQVGVSLSFSELFFFFLTSPLVNRARFIHSSCCGIATLVLVLVLVLEHDNIPCCVLVKKKEAARRLSCFTQTKSMKSLSFYAQLCHKVIFLLLNAEPCLRGCCYMTAAVLMVTWVRERIK